MPEPRCLPACSILLLAGGRGQRMGGQDKGLIAWQGQPLIAHLHRRVRGLTDDLIISCNRNQARYAEYADRLVEDGQTGFPGPLAGILAGLRVARHGALLVLPCDVPNIDDELLQDMRTTAARRPGQPLMLSEGAHWQPLLCVIPTALRASFEQAWVDGQRSPGHVMRQLGSADLPCAPGDPRLANLNTPDLLNGAPSSAPQPQPAGNSRRYPASDPHNPLLFSKE